MLRWMAVALALVLLPGCSEPDDRFPPWEPSSIPGGPQVPANGTFQFVDVSGTLREVGSEPELAACDISPANAHVDLERRKLVLDQATMDAWNYAATLIVRDTVQQSGCNIPYLRWPQPDLRFRAGGSAMGLTMHLLPLYGGPAIGASRVLEEGVPYHHRVHWQEVDPATGDERGFILDVTFLYHGLWSWADAEVGAGETHWVY